MKTLFCLILITISVLSISAKDFDWWLKLQKIKPLVSTESDVESLFGKPLKIYSNIRDYQSKDGLLSVSYSTGKCFEKKPTVWDEYDVKKGTVTRFDFDLYKKIKFSKLKIDLTNFQEDRGTDNPSLGYKNSDIGIYFDTGMGTLYNISVYPSDKLSYLECAK